MTISFKIKLILVFVLISLIISLFSLFIIYQQTIKAQMEDLKASLLMTATLGAELIDGDAHRQVGLDRASINSTYYQYIKNRLRLIREINPKIRYVYTLTKSDDGKHLFFVVDSAQIEELFSYPGDSYESLSERDVLSAFRSPQVNDALIQDTWGSYMSGYAPIFDARGNAVAVLGLDMSGETIDETRRGIQHNIVMVFIICTFMSVILGIALATHLTNPINKLVEGTEKIADGNLKYTVDVKTKDELGNLAAAFNRMSESLKEGDKKLRTSFLNTIRALTMAIEAKDPYTKGHSERVMQYGVVIAQEMNVSKEEIENLKYLYIMHDVGKIGIDGNILNKPGDLSPEERKVITEHSSIGGTIIEPISFLNKELMQIVTSHHERQDGKGYPEGLKDDEIPLSVAILTVADAYDAMITDRPYRKALTPEAAKEELIKNAGTQFRKEVVEAFLKVLSSQEAKGEA